MKRNITFLNNQLQRRRSLKKKKESATKSLEKQKKEKAKVLNKIASAINNQKKTKQKLIDDEKKLTRIIETLIKKSKVEAKKRSQKQSIVADNETLPDSSLDDVNFKKLKKKLSKLILTLTERNKLLMTRLQTKKGSQMRDLISLKLNKIPLKLKKRLIMRTNNLLKS